MTDTKFDVTSEFVDVPKSDVDTLIAQYRAADMMMDAAKAQLDAAKQAIIDKMGQAETLRIEETGQHVVDHRVVYAMVIDTAKFKKEQPQIAAKYQKERVSRPFKLLI